MRLDVDGLRLDLRPPALAIGQAPQSMEAATGKTSALPSTALFPPSKGQVGSLTRKSCDRIPADADSLNALSMF